MFSSESHAAAHVLKSVCSPYFNRFEKQSAVSSSVESVHSSYSNSFERHHTVSSSVKSVHSLYFKPFEPYGLESFSECLADFYFCSLKKGQALVFLCIGSDRITGDSLGPITGHLLRKSGCRAFVYGELSSPVHAGNLARTIDHIRRIHGNAFVIAIDASVGRDSHIGCVSISDTSLFPGSGVGKHLPSVGSISITGIVSGVSPTPALSLNETRLHSVFMLSEFILEGIKKAGLLYPTATH